MRQALSQEGLAAKADLAARYLQEIEIGATNISVAVLVELAAALGVDERTLLKPAKLPAARVGRPPKRKQ